jgi:sugar/nucleoside kinase (ribokinase family)
MAPAIIEAAQRSGILGGGVWLIDSTKHIDHYPEPSRLATISDVARSNGGGAFNVLVDLAKLNAEFPLTGVGSIGNDAAGDWILEQCRLQKIDTSAFARHADAPTSGTDVMTEIGSGRRTFFYLPGANARLALKDFPLTTSTARILYLGYPGLVPALDQRSAQTRRTGVVELFAEAQRLGFVTAADLVSAETTDWAAVATALPHLDLLFVNEWEAAKLLQLAPAAEEALNADTLIQLGRAVLAQGVRRAVIVHSHRGAVCVAANADSVRLGAVRVPPEELKGTCGAGDALAAGFLLGFHRGLVWGECLELAVCAAATCLHDLSASNGIRPWRDCLAYGRARGFADFS